MSIQIRRTKIDISSPLKKCKVFNTVVCKKNPEVNEECYLQVSPDSLKRKRVCMNTFEYNQDFDMDEDSSDLTKLFDSINEDILCGLMERVSIK